MLLIYGGLACLLYAQFAAGQNGRKNRNLCIAIAIFLFLISAFKSVYYSQDVFQYWRKYLALPRYTISSLFTMWRKGSLKDGVFWIVAKIFSLMKCDVYIWLGFISLLFAVSVGIFLYRHSAKPFLSLLLLMTLEYFSFSMTGLRQAMALSFVLLSYQFILDRKLLWFLLSVAVAWMFHSSALVFLPAYWLATWKMGWRQLGIFAGVILMLAFMPNLIRRMITTLSWNNFLGEYAEQTRILSLSGAVIQGFILIFCFFFRKETRLDPYMRWRKIDAFLNCMMVGLCFNILSTMIAEMFRIAYYYNICCIAAVPNVIEENKREQNHSVMYIVVGACLLAYLIWNQKYSNFPFLWRR